MARLKYDFLRISKGMGMNNALRLILFPRVLGRLGFNNAYEKAVDRFIGKNLKDIISKYKEIDHKNEEFQSITNIIWVFWWQGEESMPSVIQECYNSILRNANGREVRLLTKSNYQEYVKLPSHILDKFNSQIITCTHFSDILRVALLSLYGGLWIDAAIFVTKPIPIYKGPFYSPMLTTPEKASNDVRLWCFGVLGSPSGSPFFSYMYEMFVEYWSKYNEIFTYLMMDYFVAYGYNHFPWLKQIIDNRPIDSSEVHVARYLFDKEVNHRRLDELIMNNTFLSLTYRINYPMKLSNGSDTYYSTLLNKYH